MDENGKKRSEMGASNCDAVTCWQGAGLGR